MNLVDVNIESTTSNIKENIKSLRKYSEIQSINGDFLDNKESEKLQIQLLNQLNMFIGSENYDTLFSFIEYLVTNKVSINHIVSKIIRYTFEMDYTSIDLVINKCFIRFMNESILNEINFVRILWLTIDKINVDY